MRSMGSEYGQQEKYDIDSNKEVKICLLFRERF